MSKPRTRIRSLEVRAERRTANKSKMAQTALRNAAAERALARKGGANAAMHLAEAERIEYVAADLMTPMEPPVVRSGEVVRASDGVGPPQEFVDTLTHPDQAAIEASVARADLLSSTKADIVAMAIDAAVSAKADNSLSKMLAHQLSLVHALTMRTGTRALELERRHGPDGDGLNQADSLELSRLAQTTSRLCTAFQTGVLALQRLSNGGTQSMTIRHINIEGGAQAVIGNINPGGCGTGARRRSKAK